MASVEAQYLEKEDLSKYQGKWIAVLDKKIIAAGKNISEVYSDVRSKKVSKTPLFQYVPEKGEVDTFIL